MPCKKVLVSLPTKFCFQGVIDSAPIPKCSSVPKFHTVRENLPAALCLHLFLLCAESEHNICPKPSNTIYTAASFPAWILQYVPK